MQTRWTAKTILTIALFALAGCQSSKTDANKQIQLAKSSSTDSSHSGDLQRQPQQTEISVAIIDSTPVEGKVRISIGDKSQVFDLAKMGREAGFPDGTYKMSKFYSRQSMCGVIEFVPNGLFDTEFFLEITFDCKSAGQAVIFTYNDNQKVWRFPLSEPVLCTQLKNKSNQDNIGSIAIATNILILGIQGKTFKANLAEHLPTGHWARYHDYFYQNFSGILEWTCEANTDGSNACFCDTAVTASDDGFDPTCGSIRFARYAFITNKDATRLTLKLIVSNFNASGFPDKDSTLIEIPLAAQL